MQSLFIATHKSTLLLLFISLTPLLVWLDSLGAFWNYFILSSPPGQIAYNLSKLAGLYAFYFLGLQIILGLIGKNSIYFKYHRYLGLITFITILLHFSLFFSASILRSSVFPIETIWPIFNKGYYKALIGVGVCAGYFVFIIFLSGLLRARIKLFGLIHKVAPTIAALAFIHSFCIGSDTRTLVLSLFYYGIMFAVVLAFLNKNLNLIRRSQTTAPKSH